MLYDVHTHIGVDQAFVLRGWWPYAATAQDLLQLMDAGGIDRAVCFPFCLPSAFDAVAFADRRAVELLPGRVPFDRENFLLAQELQRIDTQKRLRVLAIIDPSRRVAEQVKNLEPLRGRIAGLKVQGTVIESPIAALLGAGRPLMEFAEAHRMPVLVHTSINPSDTWSQARDCIAVAAAFPKARFNLAHSLRFHAPSLREAAQLPNVWIDCSAHLAHCDLARDNFPAVAVPAERVDADYTRPAQVLEAIHAMLGGKYMWGSDNPFMSWCDDGIRIVHSYREEADVLHALPAAVKHSMATAAPEAWLLGQSARPS
jgi:hypothetical protein